MTVLEQIKEFINDETLTMTDYDDCIIGVVEQFGRPPIVCYDKNKVLEKLQKDGMNECEAMEYFEYNQLGAYMGEETPCFLSVFNNKHTGGHM